MDLKGANRRRFGLGMFFKIEHTKGRVTLRTFFDMRFQIRVEKVPAYCMGFPIRRFYYWRITRVGPAGIDNGNGDASGDIP